MCTFHLHREKLSFGFFFGWGRGGRHQQISTLHGLNHGEEAATLAARGPRGPLSDSTGSRPLRIGQAERGRRGGEGVGLPRGRHKGGKGPHVSEEFAITFKVATSKKKVYFGYPPT